MSDDNENPDHTEGELPDDIVPLAEEYLEFVELEEKDNAGEADAVELDQLRQEIEDWEQEIADLKESDELYDIAVEEKESLEARLNEREREDDYRERVRQRFLERASSEFVARDEWLHPSVIRAITHTVIGEQREEILLDDYRLPDADLDNRVMFHLSQNVRSLVSHRLGEERMSKLWENLEDTRQHQILEVLVRSAEPLGPSKIAQRLDKDDIDRRHISATLSNAREKKYHPFYRTDGDYQPSLIGELLWREFGSGEEMDNEDDDSDEESSDSDLSDF
jgi:hypothetical protein